MSNLGKFKSYLQEFSGESQRNIVLAIQASNIITRDYLQDYTSMSSEAVIEILSRLLQNGLLEVKVNNFNIYYLKTRELLDSDLLS
jgi:hypothetical protein